MPGWWVQGAGTLGRWVFDGDGQREGWPVVVAGRGGSSEHEARLQVGLWRRLPGERTVQPSRHLREIPSGAGEAAGQTLTQR